MSCYACKATVATNTKFCPECGPNRMRYLESAGPAFKKEPNWQAQRNRQTAASVLKGSGFVLIFLSPLASSFSHGNHQAMFTLYVLTTIVAFLTFLTALFRFITGL